jgi:arginine-tRNA-protein transferase
MTDSSFPGRKLRYYLSQPAPCPYLEGKEERKVFVHLPAHEAVMINDQLSHIGFRRSQNIAYRPACLNCNACQSIRIPVADYPYSRSDRRLLAKNADLSKSLVEAVATEEQFALLQTYLAARHPDGGMVDMRFSDMQAMVEDTLVRSHIIEYRKDERLVAAVLIDALGDGLSMVYSFYAPDLEARSLGHFMILDHINQAKIAGYSFVYLGYFVEGSPKMGYKARYRPHELLGQFGWVRHN